MSYSNAEVQMILDDMAMVGAQINPLFTRDGGDILSLFLSKGEENTEYQAAFKNFQTNYGTQAGEYLLAVLNSDTLKGMEKDERKIFWERKVYQYLAADGLTDLSVHWVKEKPPVFNSLLSEYPGMGHFLLSDEAHYEQLSALPMTNNYSPSFSLLAEFVIDKKEYVSVAYLDGFTLNAGPTLAGFVVAKGLALQKEEAKVQTLKLDHSSFINSERQQKREQGAETALQLLVQIKQKACSTLDTNRAEGQSWDLDEVEKYNSNLLIRAVLEGKSSVERVVDGKKQQKKVSAIIGFDTVNMAAMQRLKIAEQIEALKSETHRMNSDPDEQEREQSTKRISDFLLSMLRKDIEKSTVNYQSEEKEISQYNEKALMVAILEGKKSFEMVVKGKWFNRTVRVADVIGVHPAEIVTPSQRLETVNNLEGLKSNHCKKLWFSTLEDMKNRRDTLDNVHNKIDSKTVQMHAVFSKGTAILEAAEEYKQLNPHVPEGYSIFKTTPGIDLEQCSPIKRLEIFRQHCKEAKAFVSGGPVQKLLDFAKIIKHFVHKKLDKVVARKAVVEESKSSSTLPVAKSDEIAHGTAVKLSEVAAALFHTNHPTVFPTPGAIKIPGIEPPRIA